MLLFNKFVWRDYDDKCPPVKFVVDVDNIGSIEEILQVFLGYDVEFHFFVKNQLELKIPKCYGKGIRINLEIMKIKSKLEFHNLKIDANRTK